MDIMESLKVAIRALSANKLRTALTMLGMIIGVGAVIALTSIGAGAQARITGQIEGMGSNLLFIRPGATQQGGVRSTQGSAATLTLEDAEAIADPANAPAVSRVAPESSTFAQVIAGGQNVMTRVLGTTPEYQDVRNFRPADGEFITRQQVEARSSVVVLGANVAKSLFGGASPVDQSVSVAVGERRINFRVVGVLEAKGGTGFGNQDDLVVVPITTLQQRLYVQRAGGGGTPNVSTINVQVTSTANMAEAVQQVGDLLRQRHRVAEDDFTIQSQEDILSVATETTGMMTILLGAIAGISLVVGGIGIMNIMLVSVTERTREIGLRKAVGARRRDILQQFMIEAVVVSLVGGVLGVALGVGGSRLLAGVQVSGQTLPAVVTPEAIVLAVGVSAAVGVFFGIYPATRASRLHPIEALHYE